MCSLSSCHSLVKPLTLQTKTIQHKRQVVYMNKSIQNDADIMLLISQLHNKVSVTEIQCFVSPVKTENYTSQGSGPI